MFALPVIFTVASPVDLFLTFALTFVSGPVHLTQPLSLILVVTASSNKPLSIFWNKSLDSFPSNLSSTSLSIPPRATLKFLYLEYPSGMTQTALKEKLRLGLLYLLT